MKSIIFLIFALLTYSSFGATTIDQEITITPSLSVDELDNLSFDFNQIDLTSNQYQANPTISTVLEEQADITTVASGTAAQTTSLFLQGGNSEDVLVLIDGIKVNDPSSTSGGFDFSQLDMSNIAKIEILKGPQSGRYGADAFSGVIKITTKNFTKSYYHIALSGGSYKTTGISMTAANKINNFSYNLHLNRDESDGFSNLAIGSEDDGYLKKSASLKVTQKVDHSELSAKVHYLKKEIDLDGVSSTTWQPYDDPNYTADHESIQSQVKYTTLLANSFYRPTINYQFNKEFRHYLNLADNNDAGTSNTTYKGQRKNLIFNNSLFWNSTLKTEIGLSYVKDTMHSNSFSERSQEISGVFLQQMTNLQVFNCVTNIRYDNVSTGNDYFTYQLGVNKKINYFTLQAAYSYAVKNPTLYQLYSNYGDQHLKEEHQRGGNLSITYAQNKTKLKTNLFYYDLSSLIDFNLTTYKYYNNGEATRKGYEVEVRQQLSPIMLIASYTYTVAVQKDGTYLLRRPRNKAALSLLYGNNNYNFKFTTKYIGQRNATNGIMPSFVKCNLYASYQFNSQNKLSLQWDNIFNQPYEMAKGYQTAGSSLYLKWGYTF